MKKADIYLAPGRAPGELTGDITACLNQGIAMIHWQVKGAHLPREQLWRASKQGGWNHVSGTGLFDPGMPDGEWIANTPDIVHSFEDRGAENWNAGTIIPAALFAYRRLPAVPGQPLWREGGSAAGVLKLLAAHGKKTLLRMRRDEDSADTWLTGSGLEYRFQRPEAVPTEVMEDIIAMVDAGGSVDITHVRANLKKAYLIGYAVENGIIAGNSSLKHPRPVFIDRLKQMTGMDFSRCVERGYTSVRPEYRSMGIGAALLEGLTQRVEGVKVFSIISEDNLATQKIAIRNNTRKLTTYFSDKLGKKMGVWMPEHMISPDMAKSCGNRHEPETDR